MNLADLKPDSRNRRKHTPRNLAMLGDALRDVGAARSIVIDEAGEILAGNGVVQAATAAGYSRVQVVDADGDAIVAVRRSGLTTEQKRSLALYDNRVAELAEWDWQQLADDRDAGLPLSPYWTNDELADEFATAKKGHTDPDAVPDPRPTAIQRGDLFDLGAHRLLCGDATNAADVARVLAGDRADLCLTDPPYGVDVDYADMPADSEAALTALAARWLPIAQQHAAVVVFSCGVTRQWLYPVPAWVICWFHGAGAFCSPWGFSCWQPFLAYGPDPSLASGNGRRPDSVSCNASAPADSGHPCPKPIALWQWFFERLTFEVDAQVLDVFSGSGTTILTAEQTRRRARAIEYAPVYCQIAIDRWEAFTGGRAVKVGDARA